MVRRENSVGVGKRRNKRGKGNGRTAGGKGCAREENEMMVRGKEHHRDAALPPPRPTGIPSLR